MAKDKNPQPPEDAGADHDTDEWLRDHAEQAPDESRISVEKIEDVDKTSIRRRANVDDLGGSRDEGSEDNGAVPPLSFARNDDFMGSEARIPADADYSRGSGFIGGKLWGEEAFERDPGEEATPEEAAPKGFDSSEDQVRNEDAILREEEEEGVTSSEEGEIPPEVKSRDNLAGDNWTQGRDIGNREQATAAQAFGRDIGSSGLPGIGESEDEEDIIRRRMAAAHRHSDWTAVLAKLGGSSPGSAENLQLAEKFNMVTFPSTREEVLQRLPPGSEFRIKGGVIDLREAVSECRIPVFRTTFDLIDCVKDAIRRAESIERNTA
ncbi:MAG: hypothetical protein JWO30_1243 [Fibrobacteres bacterium]|nr:hypothetical protein [Fibrobacterota bacterium]